MSHTPGPWRTHAWGDTPSSPSVNYEILSCDDTAIARIDLEFRDETGDPLVEADEMAANARLIAAAPDLLDTLRLADDALDYAQAQVDSESDRERLRHWRTRVQNVIALAEGR
jgi:hypothetical protein